MIILLGMLFSTQTLAVTNVNPLVAISDQKIDNNTVFVDRIVSAGIGWITIHNTTNEGDVGPGIGHTQIFHGINSAVPVLISNPHTILLIAMLHIDNGSIGTYEFPGVDSPVKDKSSNIVMTYFYEQSNYIPHIVVSDQVIVDSKISINLIEFNNSTGWVAIHNKTTSGSIGPTIGHSLIQMGINRNIIVTLDENTSTDTLVAMLHVDTGVIGVWDYPNSDGSMKKDGSLIISEFNVVGVTLINTDSNSIELNVNSLTSSPKILHIIFSFISAFILVLVGIINFTRNKTNKLNQIFLGFYLFIGLFQFFDALLILLGTDIEIQFANLIRDFIITSLILGLAFGVLGVLLIYFGENFVFSKNTVLFELSSLSILLIISLFSDSVNVVSGGIGYGSLGAHVQPTRTELGWIIISSYYLLSLTIIIVVLGKLLMDKNTEPELKNKLLRLLLGLVLSISFLLIFDLSFAIQEIVNIVLNNYIIHFFAHAVIVLGALLILSAYVTTIEKNNLN
jgi:hypothetical protein